MAGADRRRKCAVRSKSLPVATRVNTLRKVPFDDGAINLILPTQQIGDLKEVPDLRCSDIGVADFDDGWKEAVSRLRQRGKILKKNVRRLYTATAQGDVTSMRRELAEMARLGGPEVAGVWGAVKLGTGVTISLASSHLIVGGAMVMWGASAVAGAAAWGSNRQAVHGWLLGNSAQDSDHSNEAEQRFEEKEEETEETCLP